MRTKAILITGAAGEIGHALIESLSKQEIPLLNTFYLRKPFDSFIGEQVLKHELP